MLNVLSNGLTLTNSIVRESSGDIDSNFRGVNADGAATTISLTNNLITSSTRSGVFASGGATINASFNDVFNPNSTHGNYEALSDATGTDGNISIDPKYMDAANRDYSLDEGSPAVDAADGNVSPEFDFIDNSRIDDPDVLNTGTGTPDFADRGALERDRWFSEIISPIRSGEIVTGDSLRVNYLIVSVDDDWDVLERRQLNNEEPLSTTAAIVSRRSRPRSLLEPFRREPTTSASPTVERRTRSQTASRSSKGAKRFLRRM